MIQKQLRFDEIAPLMKNVQSAFKLKRNDSSKTISLFGSTYTCERIFLRIKIAKSKTRILLADTRLDNSLRIASFKIQPNIEKLVSEKQYQLSYQK